MGVGTKSIPKRTVGQSLAVHAPISLTWFPFGTCQPNREQFIVSSSQSASGRLHPAHVPACAGLVRQIFWQLIPPLAQGPGGKNVHHVFCVSRCPKDIWDVVDNKIVTRRLNAAICLLPRRI